MTYLFACSKPSITFISSNCLCITMPELVRMWVAGCFSFRTPCRFSGIWTGDSRLFSSFLVSRKASDSVSFGSGSSLESSLEDFVHGRWRLASTFDGRGRALYCEGGGGLLARPVANVARWAHLKQTHGSVTSFVGGMGCNRQCESYQGVYDHQ